MLQEDLKIKLKGFLESFLSSKVSFHDGTLENMKQKFKIIVKSDKQNAFCIDEKTKLLTIFDHEQEGNILCNILITGELLSEVPLSYFNNLSVFISEVCVKSKKMLLHQFYKFFPSDIFCKLLISYLISTSAYNQEKIFLWIEKIEKLAASTFEGRPFSTGFILTRTLDSYKAGKKDSQCEILDFFKEFKIYDFLDDLKRSWFLVNGIDTYYISDKNKDIKNILRLKNTLPFFEKYFLTPFLKGQDTVFRTFENGQVSILNADKIEFVKIENKWKLRSIKSLIKFFNQNMIDGSIGEAITYYLLHFSFSKISTIFWIINDREILKNIDAYVSVKNDLSGMHLNIIDNNNEGLLKRIFCSDGANVFDMRGKLLYCGVIAKLEMKNKSELKGTGETAAKTLGKNGICIKVSQDGSIKIFSKNKIIIF